MKWLVQRCVYPVKERCLGCVDRTYTWWYPYTSKKPVNLVAGFSYGIVSESKGGAGK